MSRSFAFTDAGSSKFWEIQRAGIDVTVRWGRTGTTGQTKTKTFGTEEDAVTHETRLIAEKMRKGYAETTAGAAPAAVASPAVTASPVAAPPTPTAVADETVLELPAGLRRVVAGRRDRPPVRSYAPDPKARAVVDKLLSRLPRYAERALQNPQTEPELAAAGTAWLTGGPGITPAGAAAVALCAIPGNWGAFDKFPAFADLWITGHGLAFAAEAAVELMALTSSPRPGVEYDRNVPSPVRHLLPGEIRDSASADPPLMITLRVRSALAAAPDDEYAAVVAMLAGHRAAGPYQSAATSILAPTESAWVDADCAASPAPHLAAALLTATRTAAQAEALAAIASSYLVVRVPTLLATIVDGLVTDATGILLTWLDDGWSDADSRRRILSLLAALPGDEAMNALVGRAAEKYVQPALLDAAARFPARALRALAGVDGRGPAADLLGAHVLEYPDVVARVLPELDADAAGRVRAITERAAATVEAPASAVPALLADPPWLRRTPAVKPVVVDGLVCADRPAVEWADGEREQWAAVVFPRYRNPGVLDWPGLAASIKPGATPQRETISFFADAPKVLARPLLTAWDPSGHWGAGSWMRVISARFEVDALPVLLRLARHSPEEIGPLLGPFTAPEIAVLAADWLARLKKMRKVALSWLLAHPAAAARALVPPALGPAGVPRRQAEQALLALIANGQAEVVHTAAKSYGPAAAAGIETLAVTDPMTLLPARIPPVPGWATPGLLPPVQVRDGAGVLPAEAVTHLVTLLSLGRPGEPYAGLDPVREALDPASLAEFGWGMFQRWQAAGGPSKEGWVLEALGRVGDDETVRRLTPLILAWPGEGGHTRAVTGVGVLAEIGSQVALMHLHGIAQRAKFKGLKTVANEKMDEVAAALGLSAEQLADRLVPDFGLSADGSLGLDYGPRQFTVGFDEQLRPYVSDSAGKRLKALPKPGARDDAALSEAAWKQFAALKKDVRTVSGDQIRRLERAMVTGRRWTPAEFREFFAGHPLVWHIARRLVWGLYDSTGGLTGAVRVAEDRTLADVEDETVEPAADARIGVVHPLHLGAAIPAWAEVFADYEIVQPFPQLGRETFRPAPEEAAAGRLTRFEGRVVPTGKVIGLERKGWLRETPQDAGVQGRITLTGAGQQEIVVDLDPGVAVGDLTIFPEQTLTEVFLDPGGNTRWGRREKRAPLDDLDPVFISEVIRDLTEIAG